MQKIANMVTYEAAGCQQKKSVEPNSQAKMSPEGAAHAAVEIREPDICRTEAEHAAVVIREPEKSILVQGSRSNRETQTQQTEAWATATIMNSPQLP